MQLTYVQHSASRSSVGLAKYYDDIVLQLPSVWMPPAGYCPLKRTPASERRVPSNRLRTSTTLMGDYWMPSSVLTLTHDEPCAVARNSVPVSALRLRPALPARLLEASDRLAVSADALAMEGKRPERALPFVDHKQHICCICGPRHNLNLGLLVCTAHSRYVGTDFYKHPSLSSAPCAQHIRTQRAPLKEGACQEFKEGTR
jgi:hypothetical protein